MTPRFRYPRFEENQVLSYQHLNQLTDFLEGEDRLSRRALIGAGVAHGLGLELVSSQGLRLGRGAALTTDGSLCHLEADTVFVAARTYRDPAGYPPFHPGGSGSTQTELWEALEEAPADAAGVSALTGSAGATFLADKAALLYLERTTADLDTCIDNHCINQGQEKRGVWRVLLARRSDLAALRQAALGTLVPWPAWTLDELRAERLCLQSADVLSHQALSARGLNFIRQARTRLLPAIQEAVPLYGALLEVTPQTTADALNALGAGLDAWLAGVSSGDRVGWQHGLDHLRHLYRAWGEFVEAAFACVTEPAPLREPFPQHVLLGIVPTARYGEPDSLRHSFVPSPVLTLGGRDREWCRHRFQRLLSLATSFTIPASRGVRVTPGAALDHILDEQAVPFYYQPAAALGWWSADATARNRGRLLPCYHREALLNDPAVRDPLRFPSDTWEFYRIEGHQGRDCREVEQALDTLRRTYHLAFDLVTVTFGPDDPEVTNCLCELEGLKVLHRVSADEMRCHIARLLGFLGALLKPATAGAAIFDKIVLPDGAVSIGLNLQKAQFLALSGGFRAPAPGAQAATAAAPKAGDASLAAAASAPAGAAAAANAVVASQSEDVRTVSVDNLRISYPIISAVLYPFLTPEVLVNSLARELMGRLTEADGRLGAALEAFNADQFDQTVRAARAKASDLADALLTLGTDVADDVAKQRELLRQELLLFLANCVPTRVLQIATLHAAALERLRATPTLAAFLRKHPGLEHLGGVPKGGTFVLVCGRPEAAAGSLATATPAVTTAGLAGMLSVTAGAVPQSTAASDLASGLGAVRAKAAANPAAGATAAARAGSQTAGVSASLLLKTYGLYQATPSTNTLVDKLATGANLVDADKLLLTENYTPVVTGPGPATIDLEAIYERLRDFFGFGTATRPDVVLADFCLPYVCCAECTCTTTVVLPAPPATISLPATVFCGNDETSYPVTVSPAGGQLFINGTAVAQLTFTPASLSAGGTAVLEYRVGTQSATLSVQVQRAPVLTAAATVGTPTADGADVRLTASADDAATAFTWRFADGSTATGPVAGRRFAAPGSYSVVIEGRRDPCVVTRTVSFEVPAPSAPPSLRLGGTDATSFCTSDRTTYEILASPDGGELTLNGVAVPGRVFIPAQSGGDAVLEWTYRLADGRSATLRVALVSPAAPAFGFERVDATADGIVVRFFNNTGGGGEKFLWRFDRDQPERAIEDSEFDWVFPERRVYTVSLRATRGPCTDATATQEIDLREERPPVITWNPGRLEVVLGDGLVREVVGAQNPDVLEHTMALNERAAQASNVPAARAELDTAAAEKEIGSRARKIFTPLATVLLEQAANLPRPDLERLWEFAQMPVAATLYLASLRTRDLAPTGELARAFSTLKEVLEPLRASAHGANLEFDPQLAALLEATAADLSKPALQGLSRQTAAAFGRPRGRAPLPKRRGAPPPARTPRKPRPPGKRGTRGRAR